MVIGLDHFRQHLAQYMEQYVLIGGTACTVIMQEAGIDFRATKDLDIVLHVEALKEDFAKAFWQYGSFKRDLIVGICTYSSFQKHKG